MAAGTVLDVVSTLATVVAVGVALFFSVRAEVRAVAGDVRRAEQERRAQAATICGWMEAGTDREDSRRVLVLRNGSTDVVYDIVATPRGGALHGEEIRIGALPPDSRLPIGLPADAGEPFTNPFVLDFTDSSGIRWRREQDGRLHEPR